MARFVRGLGGTLVVVLVFLPMLSAICLADCEQDALAHQPACHATIGQLDLQAPGSHRAPMPCEDTHGAFRTVANVTPSVAASLPSNQLAAMVTPSMAHAWPALLGGYLGAPVPLFSSPPSESRQIPLRI
jgi:hypothetical protein